MNLSQGHVCENKALELTLCFENIKQHPKDILNDFSLLQRHHFFFFK